MQNAIKLLPDGNHEIITLFEGDDVLDIILVSEDLLKVLEHLKMPLLTDNVTTQFGPVFGLQRIKVKTFYQLQEFLQNQEFDYECVIL